MSVKASTPFQLVWSLRAAAGGDHLHSSQRPSRGSLFFLGGNFNENNEAPKRSPMPRSSRANDYPISSVFNLHFTQHERQPKCLTFKGFHVGTNCVVASLLHAYNLQIYAQQRPIHWRRCQSYRPDFVRIGLCRLIISMGADGCL